MLRPLVVTSFLALVATPVAAQDAADTVRVAPVIVTATRTPLRVDQVPASATVIHGDQLRAQGITHLTDAVRALPGVVVAQSGSWGAPTSVFVRGGQSNYTKVLIDGVPANEPGGAFDFGTLTLDDVERIEVVRGPSSVVWGSDAVSAVIHIITKRGVANRGTLAVRGGSHGTVDVSGSAEQGLGAVRGAVTAAHHESDGSHAFNSDFRNTLLGGSASWLGGETSVRVGGRYARTRAHFPTDFTGAPVDSNAYRTEERTTASAELSRPVGSATVRVLGGHTLANAASVDPRNDPSGISTAFDTRTRRQQLEVRADIPVHSSVTAVVGGIAEWQHRLSASASAAPDQPTDWSATDHHRANRGAFAEVLATQGATTATVGGRYDHSETYGSFGTYRVGLSHALPTGTRVRGSVGTAFREPSFDEALPGPFSTGNPDIRPERTSSWEVGVEQRLVDERVVVGATYFAQRFTDMIDYFTESFPGRYENVAAARARGTELELRAMPHARLTVDGSMTFLHTRVETAGYGSTLADGRTLLRRPGRSAAGGLAYAGRRATLGARISHVGERQDMRFLYDAPYSREETLPAYTKVDLSAELPVLTRQGQSYALTVRLDNVFDEAFQPAAGYDAPGRTIVVGVRAAY